MIRLLMSILPGSLKRFLKKKLKKRLDTRIRRLPPVNWIGVPLETLEAVRRSKKSPALLEVPLSKCRGLRAMAFPCSSDSIHPFIMTLRSHDMDILRDYFILVQPETIGELFDIDHKTPMMEMPALSYVYPWDGKPSGSIRQYRQEFVSRETISHGGSKKFDGWHHFGPVSEDKVQLEFRRLEAIYGSIKSRGYKRSNKPDGDIAGTLLIREDDYCVVISKGHHRIAALAALGLTAIPLRVGINSNSYVDRANVSKWPGVVSSAFSTEEALQIFDRIFEGRQPAVCGVWNEYCKNRAEPVADRSD